MTATAVSGPTQDTFNPEDWELRGHLGAQTFLLNTDTRVTVGGQQIVGLIHTEDHIGAHPEWPVITLSQVLHAWTEDRNGRVVGMCQGCVIQRVKR